LLPVIKHFGCEGNGALATVRTASMEVVGTKLGTVGLRKVISQMGLAGGSGSI